MRLHINKVDTFDCYTNNILYAFCIHFHKDINSCFMDIFNFKYKLNQPKLTFGSECLFFNSKSAEEYLYKYNGINLVKYENNQSKKSFQKQIEINLGFEKPIGIEIDAYHLPWNIQYLKEHKNRYILIIGQTPSEYICIDSYLSNNYQRIKKENLLESATFMIDAFIVRQKDYTLDEIIITLKQSAKNPKNDILEFAQDILSLELTEEDRQIYRDIDRSVFIFDVANVGWHIYNYTKCLSSICFKYNTNLFEGIIQEILENYNKWIILKQLLIMSVFSKEMLKYLKKTNNLLIKIANKEEEIVNSILRI